MDQRLQEELRGQFRQTMTPADPDESRRTVGKLLALAQARGDDRRHRARQQRERQEADREHAAAAAHEKRLTALADRQQQAWLHVDELIAARTQADYDVAVALLRDLGEISRRERRTQTHEQRVEPLRQTHRRKNTFIESLDPAPSG